ncbi:hypothetical protein EDB47_11869 [Vibrio crassostreae]|nr:hypothetical protein EDB47_11869 [Vibrio crassostreae]
MSPKCSMEFLLAGKVCQLTFDIRVANLSKETLGRV